MADPNIKIKRSSVEGKIPTADQLPLGEIALNTYDGKLFASKNVGIGTVVFAVNPWTVGTGTNTYNTYFTAGNVGIGTTNPTENLSVLGKIQINQDSSSNNRLIFRGQPSSSYRWNIDNYGSSNEFRIFREDDATSANGSVAVSISTTGTVTATKFSGDGSLLTGITAAGSGVVVQNQGSTVGTAGTLNFSTNLTASFSSGTATISLSNNPSISGILTADQVYTSNNGNGTNIRIGDDFWVGDINVANTTRFSGAQDSTKAFVVFGSSDAVALGRTGTGPLYYGGDFNVAGIVTASSFSGNASSTTKLQTPRTFEITGDVVASAISFDGTGNVSLAATIQPNSVALGGDTTGNYVASITNGSYITGGDGGSESAALTLAVDATSSNTVSKVVARDASGNFSAGTITANLTGTATTATNLSDGANITTGTISDDRLPDLITSNINITSGVSTFATVKATTFEGSLTGNASSSTYATTAGVATALQNSRTFEITGDIIASPISFNGTGNVSLAATIQPNSVALGGDTTGDYVQSITGTSNQITVTGGTGESSTPTLSISNQFTAPQDVTVTRDLQVNRDLNVNGNITIGGTAATLFSQELKVFDPDIVLGFRTDGSGNDVSTDTTANHGGIAIASTEGTPLISLYDVGVGETNPATYKKFMWFKSGTFSGLGTDAWLSNYAIGIGSTQVPNGVRLSVGGVQFTENDLSVVRNINASGIVTASSFSGNASSATYASTAGVATVSQGLTGTPNITVGVVTATSFVKSGGTSSQFLKADGSVDSSTYLTSYTETDTLNSVTGRGNSTANGISVGILTATSGNFSGTVTSSGAVISGVVTSNGFNATTGNDYKINGTSVITSNTLGSGVVNSSLTSVGTLSNLNVGNVNSTGILTATSGNFSGTVTSSGANVSGVVTATSFSGSGANLTGIVTSIVAGTNITISGSTGQVTINSTASGGGGGGGSGTFDTGISTSIYVSVTSGVGTNTTQTNDIFVGPGVAGTTIGIGYSFPSTAGREYVIESIHVTNTFSNELYLVARHDFSGGSAVPTAQRVVIPYQGSAELLSQPIIANPSDILRFQALSGVGNTAVGVDGGLDAFVIYSTKTDTNYVGTGKTVTSSTGTEVFTSTTYPSVIQSIRICNYNLSIDVDASISIYRGGTVGGIVTTGVRQGYLVYNMTIPRNSVIEILEKPKYLAVNDTLVAVGSTTNSLGVTVSGKYIV